MLGSVLLMVLILIPQLLLFSARIPATLRDTLLGRSDSGPSFVHAVAMFFCCAYLSQSFGDVQDEIIIEVISITVI